MLDAMAFNNLITFGIAGRVVSAESADGHVHRGTVRSARPVDVFAHDRAVVPRLAVVPGHHLEPAVDRVQVQYRVIRVPVAVLVDPHAASDTCPPTSVSDHTRHNITRLYNIILRGAIVIIIILL